MEFGIFTTALALFVHSTLSLTPKTKVNYLLTMSMSTTDIPLANNVTMALGTATVVASYPWAAAVPGIENPNTINGVIPEGVPAEAESSEVLTASISPNTPAGNLTIVYREIRSPGSRAPNHVHRYGGVSCVQQEEL